MTFPGAETIKGGIMGDDCFRCMAGMPFRVGNTVDGILTANCAGVDSVGVCSGVWVLCDDVNRG